MHSENPIGRSTIQRMQRRCLGVTLVELVAVITITGIIAVVLGTFIVRPIQGYQATVRRAELVDAAEMALRLSARDIRRALPNSVRIRDSLGNVDNVTCNAAGVTCAIEMLNTVDGARYREGPGQIGGGHNHANTSYRLKINAMDNDGFNVVGFFQNITVPCNAPCSQYRLAIYNQGVASADAYADANAPANTPVVMTNPTVTMFTVRRDGQEDSTAFNDEDQVKPASGNFRFRYASPNQRVFIVDTPVSYVCNAGPNGNIMRYTGYPITAAQQTPPGGGPAPAVLTTPVSACSFTYTPGTNQRAGLVTLDITVRDNDSGEQVRLLHQVHVDNSP